MKREYPVYREWLKTLPCAMCVAEGPSEPHHLKGDFHQSGTGLKAPDYLAMPLCRVCHNRLHLAVGDWKERQREALIDTLIQAFECGMITVAGGIDDPLPIRNLETKDGKSCTKTD